MDGLDWIRWMLIVKFFFLLSRSIDPSIQFNAMQSMSRQELAAEGAIDPDIFDDFRCVLSDGDGAK